MCVCVPVDAHSTQHRTSVCIIQKPLPDQGNYRPRGVCSRKFTPVSSTVRNMAADEPVLRPSVPLQPPAPQVEIVRSERRRRTISAYRKGERIIVQLPARMTRAEEAQWVDRMVRRVLAGERRRTRSDAELTSRAVELSERYLAGRARPVGVRLVDNQEQRWR